MSFEAVQERWGQFLSRIESRFHELLGEAPKVLPDLLEATGFDTTPVLVALQALTQQGRELVFKIDSTWSDQVSGAFEEATGDAAAVERERQRGEALTLELEKALKRYEVQTMAEAGRRLHERARATLAKDFKCAQCGAPMPVREDFYRSYYLTCQYCQRVNTFEPGSLARNVEHFSVHPMAEEKALEAYLEYLDRDFRRRHCKEKVSRSDVEASYRRYTELYLNERARLVPEYQKDLEKDLEAKMGHFTRSNR